MRPGRAVITAMRSPSTIASSMEWVMNTMVLRSSGAAQLQQLVLEDFAGLGIERGERLVHQQDRRIDGQRADEADPLLHAARQLIRIVPLEPGEADQVQIMPHTARHHRRSSRHGKPERCVLMDGLPRQQAEMLEHHGDAVGRPAAGMPRHPLLALSRPAMQRRKVVLPQPLGPTMQRISPGAMARSMPSSATTRCRPPPYSFRNRSILIAAPRRVAHRFPA